MWVCEVYASVMAEQLSHVSAMVCITVAIDASAREFSVKINSQSSLLTLRLTKQVPWGVSPMVSRLCTGKLTHAALQFSHS